MLGFGEARAEFLQALGIVAERRVFVGAAVQTGEVGGECEGWGGREAVDDPVALAGRLHEAALAQVAEVLGDFYLRLFEGLLQVTDAQRARLEEREQPQAGAVAETFIEADEIHGGHRARRSIFRKRHIVTFT